MNNKSIFFIKPQKVEVQEQKIYKKPKKNELLLKKMYTLISPGTELACLDGYEEWFKMPSTPGYSAVSQIVDKGSNIQDFDIGDVVFHFGSHSKYEFATIDEVILKIPENFDLIKAPFIRLASIALTSIRVSNIEIGDYVIVTGLGLIGNLAAQLAKKQGGRVIGLDILKNRLDLAKKCGINKVLDSNSDIYVENIMKITEGMGASTLIEATGLSKVVAESLPLIGRFGEVILLGTPREPYEINITEFLRYCHLYEKGCITFKGAHEWRYPLKHNKYIKHSLMKNAEIVLNLIENEKLKINHLISHIVPPEKAPIIYEGIRSQKDKYNGVLFKW